MLCGILYVLKRESKSLMYKEKDKSKNSGTNSNESVDDAKNMKKNKISSRKSVLSLSINTFRYVALALLVAAVVGVGYYFVGRNKDTPSEPVTPSSLYEGTDLTYEQKARRVAYYDGYDAGKQFLEESAVAAEANPEAQVEFYFKASELAYNNEKYDEALSFAIKADGVIPTVRSASFAALSAEMFGDDETALKYYKLAAERSSAQDKMNPDLTDYGHFLIKIEQLGGSVDEN